MTTKSVSFKQRAYKTLQQRILTGQYVPGELLNRRGVATGLKMSTAPVHEAMLQLERDGLLQALSRVGTRVKTISPEDLRGHLIVREALECQAARLICGPVIARHAKQLVPLAEALDALDPRDPRTAEKEVAFHCALVERADCPALLLEYRRIMNNDWFFRTNMLMAILPAVPPDLHTQHLNTLMNSTPEEAEKAVRQHIWFGKSDIFRKSFVSNRTHN